MEGFTLLERLQTIFETIISSSFFITLLIILIFTITILVLNTKLKSKAPKIIAIGSYILLMILVLARYGGYVLAINDSVVEKFFKAMYFPNLVVYLSMLLISLLLLALNFINKNYTQITKVFNIICFALIWFFFVLVLDSAKTFGINIYEITDIYQNSTMMILLQASMCVFFVWVGILIMNLAVRKITYKLDNKPKNNEFITNDNYYTQQQNNNQYQNINNNQYQNNNINNNYQKNNKDEEIVQFSDEDFQNSYLNMQKYNKNEEINQIINNKHLDQ